MSLTASSPYTLRRFVFVTLDPVHVGTGGYRLGRVDMAILRESGTNLPKVPGTSLAGIARSYAAMRYGKPDAAGQHKNLKGRQLGCPIIYTFGTAADTTGGQAGTISIGDARLLFFPVNSMAGPVWVTTEECLREAFGPKACSKPQVKGNTVGPTDEGKAVTSLEWRKEYLNLGWLLLEVSPGLEVSLSANNLMDSEEWKTIEKRIVLVTPKIFSSVVNSNLEVRTSVSINPETGAAEDGALFTYEAIPRGTWLWCDIVEDCYHPVDSVFPITKKCKIEKSKEHNGEEKIKYGENQGEDLGEEWQRPLDVVKSGLKLAEYLGVGGMNTRGFGRMRLVADVNGTI